MAKHGHDGTSPGLDYTKLGDLREDDGVDEVMMESPMKKSSCAWLLSLILDSANVLKSFFGTNFLGSPFSFSQSGTVLGFFVVAVVVILTEHCCRLLVQVKQDFRKKGEDNVSSYGDIGHAVFGKFGLWAVNFFLAFTQFGFCVSYMTFMMKNLNHILSSSVPDVFGVVIPAVAVVPFCFTKEVSNLRWSSLFANFALFTGLIMCYTYLDLHSRHDVSTFKWSTVAVSVGITTSAYEGIGLVVPLEESMKRKPGRYLILLDIMIGLMTAVLTSFGILGYLTFGDDISEEFSSSLPKSILSQLVRVWLVLAVGLTYPMQIYPVTEVCEPPLFKSGGRPKSYWDVRRNLFRVFLVVCTAAIAFFVPYFGLISAVVGSFGSTALAYIIPAVIHTMHFRLGISRVVLVKNGAICVIGAVFLVIGTGISVKQIVDKMVDRL